MAFAIPPRWFKLFSRLDIAFDFACVVVHVVSVSVGDEERRSFFDAEGKSLIFVVLRVDDGVGDACFVEHRFCHFAVGASLCGEYQKTFVIALLAASALFLRFVFLHHLDVASSLVVANELFHLFAVILRVCDIVHFALFKFRALTVVPVLNGTIVACDTTVNFRLLSAYGAGVLLAFEIAVLLANGVGRRERIVGQFVVFGNLSHKVCRSLPAVKALTEERVEHRAGRIESLQLVLDVESGEDVARVSDGKVRTVGVVGHVVHIACADDVGISFSVVFCKTIGSGFCRRCFEVVQITVFFLIVAEFFTHEVEHFLGEFLRFFVRHILSDPVCVEAGLVHAHKTDCGEVVSERAEVSLGVGIKSFVEKFGDDVSLDFERASGHVHKAFELFEEFFFGFAHVRDARHIYGYDADRTRRLAAAEEAARFFAEFAQVKTQAAAHTAHVAGLHVGVDVVGEVRSAVFCRHREEKAVVFGVRPVEVSRDGVSRNRILEASAVGVTLDHDLDKRLVDHRHFFDAVFIFEVHFLAADDCGKFRQIVWHNPVERDVGERCLRTPTRRRVDAVNEGLDALFDFFVREVVNLYERCEIRVERAERLCARPFVLHDAEEVDHLVAERGKVSCRRRGDFAGDSAKAFLDELFERPTCAITGEHGQIVDMNLSLAVSFCDFIVVDFAEPVVCCHRAGVGKDKTAHRVRDRRVFLDAPVVDFEIVVHRVLVVEHGGVHLAEFFVLFSVKNVGFCHFDVARLNEDDLNGVLNILDAYDVAFNLVVEGCGDAQSKHVDDVVAITFVHCRKRFFDCDLDFVQIEWNYTPVSFFDVQHIY